MDDLSKHKNKIVSQGKNGKHMISKCGQWLHVKMNTCAKGLSYNKDQIDNFSAIVEALIWIQKSSCMVSRKFKQKWFTVNCH